MSRFPDFMHVDLTKITCSGCFLILLSLLLAFGTAVGGGILLMGLFPGLFPEGRPERWLAVLLLFGGFALGGGAFQVGRFLLKRLGLRIYRDASDEPE
jgi:hypothetical protein